MNVQAYLFGVYAVALVCINELAPRLTSLRHGAAFQSYALKELRPWVYSMSLGAFCAIGIFGAPTNGFVTGVLLVPAVYAIAARVYGRFA